MNWLSLLLLPLAIQFIGYLVALSAVSGGGSFVGLVMMPVAVLSTLLLLVFGVAACVQLGRDRHAPIGRYLAIQWLLAIGPALLALLMRAIEKAA